MKSVYRWVLVIAVLAAGSWLGYRLGNSATTPVNSAAPRLTERATPRPENDRAFRTKIRERAREGYKPDHAAMNAGALTNQRVLRFSDRASLEAFLKSIEGTGVINLGRIDSLNLLRVGFLNADQLAGLLGDDVEQEYIFPANIPGSGTVQEGALGFGTGFRQWLGIQGDQAGWGEGIKIAVLDTGVGTNEQFTNRIIQEQLVELPADASQQNGHGTAVASIIASELGLAPDATILSYRIADDQGSSNTFVLAQAIIEAADAGVDLINISLGSRSHSPSLQQAVEYAAAAGVVIVASSGNDGYASVSYPAAYDQVVGVGAVDANGSHLDFSNSGEISLTAPGLALTSAWIENQTVSFTGTSAAAPVVTGALAAVMSTRNVTAASALEILTAQANDGGAPGYDPAYGSGYIDLGRVQRQGTSDYTDLAVASNYFTVDAQRNPIVQVTVQNRGTTQIINAPVTVNTPSGLQQMNVTSLPPGGVTTFEIPLPNTGTDVTVQSTARVSGGSVDQNVSNNVRVDVHPAAESP